MDFATYQSFVMETAKKLLTTDSPSGIRQMQTLRKLPRQLPKMNANTIYTPSGIKSASGIAQIIS